MLKHIAIKDFAIVSTLDLDLEGGMTVITGETGAGKSIMLDALGLCVGDRADARTVRPGARRADITAIFDLSAQPRVQQWLAERDLDTDDTDCILRRTITAEGRSRAFINGSPATLADCAELGTLLVDIHSQHAHQSLLRKRTQGALLDAFAEAGELVREVADRAQQCQALIDEHTRLSNQSEVDIARRDLLRYQTQELDELALQAGDVEQLESDQRSLANASYLLESSGQAAEGCERQAGELSRLRELIDDDRHDDKAVANIRELMASAQIQLDEARRELQSYNQSIEIDPGRLREVEERLDTVYDLARKHRLQPHALHEQLETLREELDNLDGDDERLEQLAAEIQSARSAYQTAATRLTKARTKAAKTLAQRVKATLSQLAMERCEFVVSLTPTDQDKLSPRGAEDIEFLISTNPGAEPGPLSKIASGGELSRISLALQVAAAESVTAPTMIFDEVDVGIGGGVAEVVGDLLRSLAERTQVLCVTHLAQVAAKGQQHLSVSKSGNQQRVDTEVAPLDHDQRVGEIARMLAGMTITDSSMTHAREMLEGKH